MALMGRLRCIVLNEVPPHLAELFSSGRAWLFSIATRVNSDATTSGFGNYNLYGDVAAQLRRIVLDLYCFVTTASLFEFL